MNNLTKLQEFIILHSFTESFTVQHDLKPNTIIISFKMNKIAIDNYGLEGFNYTLEQLGAKSVNYIEGPMLYDFSISLPLVQL